jgi:hypothetical protein
VYSLSQHKTGKKIEAALKPGQYLLQKSETTTGL